MVVLFLCLYLSIEYCVLIIEYSTRNDLENIQ
jgi:hypothetical protein